jgi:hypothetical protein
MITFNAKEWFEKGLPLVKAKPYVEGIEASNQTIAKKPDNTDSYTIFNSSDLMLDDNDSGVEASKDIKRLPPKKNTNLYSKLDFSSLSGKNAIEEGADKNIITENEIIEKSIIDNTNKAYRTFYTIQAGSFKNMKNAHRQFNTLITLSYKKEFNHLRIERIDNFNVVRFGKFEGYSNAVKLIEEIKPYISTAVILEAHIKDENIAKLHKK